ncbi:hypothetical protein [Serratia rubidaea]|uniref:hypothetical protein n=1 Tax=Serratia rubidaea TaxID=61652 RepID=UPI003FA3D59B
MEKFAHIILNFFGVVAVATVVIWILIQVGTRLGERGRFIAVVIAIIVFINVFYFAAQG